MAKINLGLDVTGVRPDGYHDVRMVMQTICLSDLIEIRREKNPGIRIRTNLPYLPADSRNLAYRAAQMMMQEFHLPGGIALSIHKRIPVAAGMAGGSTDAAAVLYGMNRMYGTGLSQNALMERGVKLGADVPFCIMRGTVLAEGIGEVLTRVDPLVPCFIVAAKPAVSVSTKEVYEKLDVEGIAEHPDIDGLLAALASRDLAAVSGCLGNVLESVTVRSYPRIGEIKDTMTKCGACGTLMSGSGPSVFGLFPDRGTAVTAERTLRKRNLTGQIFITVPYNIKSAEDKANESTYDRIQKQG